MEEELERPNGKEVERGRPRPRVICSNASGLTSKIVTPSDSISIVEEFRPAYFTLRMTTDGTLFTGAAAVSASSRSRACRETTSLRLASEPRRGRHGSMKFRGQLGLKLSERGCSRHALRESRASSLSEEKCGPALIAIFDSISSVGQRAISAYMRCERFG
jgi:hypothetical protein